MKLQTVNRKAGSKSDVKKLRREGFIPAVVYRRGQHGDTVAVDGNQFGAILRHVQSGHLPTTIFTLVDDSGKERRVIVKEIQYAITTYDVTHLDFEELVPDHKINVKVPIECVGQVDCVGIKLGGVLRQPIRHLRIRCLPKDMPLFFEIDIKSLNLNQTKRLFDLEIPQTVRPLVDLNEVLAVIVKR